ncbi:hypothetical protein [Cupriavidus gilardii]|uniref:hypothetical protein n=1 Tax=Cupriavidus gilardii TaxID=82541 RepID=UPI0021BF28FD|nr:hypothetical protein [Cupriavidus gilardii]MCT9124728.1 hypothetical protein [Cupriavidus gilardii]
MPTLLCCARRFHAAHYPTPRDFFNAVAKGTDERTLRRIVVERAPFFVGSRGYRLVVENAGRPDEGGPADIRLERNWREFGWFRRVVLTLLSCVVPRDRQRCERPTRGQLCAVSHTIARLRQGASVAVPVVARPRDTPPQAVEPEPCAAEPRLPISPVLTPEAGRARIRLLLERIDKANCCKLFANKAKWCKVVRAIAGNDPPECHDVVAATVLAQMAAVVTYLRRHRMGNASAYAEVMGILQALHDAAEANDDKLADLAARLTAVWKQHWWRGEIPPYSAFAAFRLPGAVARRIGAFLRADALLFANELCTLELRDRQIKRLIAAASAKPAPAVPADGADRAAPAVAPVASSTATA